MKIQNILIDKTPNVAHALGGAGGFAQGMLGGMGAFQELQARAQQMESELADRGRRDAMLDLAVREADLQAQSFLENKRRFDAEQADKASKRNAYAALNRTLFGMVMSEDQPPKAQQEPMIPPEWERSDIELRRLADSGEITPAQFASAMKMHAAVRGTALRERATQEFVKSIERDTIPAPGGGGSFWTSAGALGVEVDYDEKTGPDPLESIPSIAIQRLQDGESPESVGAWYQGIKDHVEQQTQRRLAINGVAEEIAAEVGTRSQRLNARQRAEIAVELARFQRGDGEEYRGFDEIGERAVRSRVAQIEAGTVPIKIGGKIVYVSPEDAEALKNEFSGDPQEKFDRDLLDSLSKFLGRFEPNPAMVEDGAAVPEEVQFQRYLARAKALREAIPELAVRHGLTNVQPLTQMPEDATQVQGAMLPTTLRVQTPTPPSVEQPQALNLAPTPTGRAWSGLDEGTQSAVVQKLEMAIKTPWSPTAVQEVLDELRNGGIDPEELPSEIVERLAGKPEARKRRSGDSPHGQRR